MNYRLRHFRQDRYLMAFAMRDNDITSVGRQSRARDSKQLCRDSADYHALL